MSDKIVWPDAEFDDAVRRVYEAWKNPGSHPAYHNHMVNELSKKWPVLYRALVNLDREYNRVQGRR